uniref:Uncharacterized protein n=1 Tax=Cacopsylla melanoneura TaxID=428564 RepID=A0A8D8XGL0_9HEMI
MFGFVQRHNMTPAILKDAEEQDLQRLIPDNIGDLILLRKGCTAWKKEKERQLEQRSRDVISDALAMAMSTSDYDSYSSTSSSHNTSTDPSHNASHNTLSSHNQQAMSTYTTMQTTPTSTYPTPNSHNSSTSAQSMYSMQTPTTSYASYYSEPSPSLSEWNPAQVPVTNQIPETGDSGDITSIYIPITPNYVELVRI